MTIKRRIEKLETRVNAIKPPVDVDAIRMSMWAKLAAVMHGDPTPTPTPPRSVEAAEVVERVGAKLAEMRRRLLMAKKNGRAGDTAVD